MSVTFIYLFYQIILSLSNLHHSSRFLGEKVWVETP